MKKLTLSLFTLAISMWAADFWVAKPYTEWSEKDAVKLTKSSPWAKEVTVTMGGAGGMDSGMGGGGKGRSRGGSSGSMGETGGMGGAVTSNSAGAAGGGSGMGGGDIGGRGSASDMGGGMGGGGGMSSGMAVTFRWESAMVVKQAKAKQKYGSEVATSEAAQKLATREDNVYILSVGPLPAIGGEQVKTALMEGTVLNVKGKTALKPVQVEVMGAGRGGMYVFAFPKTTPLTAEDGEIEFVAKVAGSPVKCKFDLKKMVVNGKLDM